MGALTRSTRLGDVLVLRQSRALLRTPGGRLLAASIALVYLLVSLVVGQMLILGPTHQVGTTVYLITNGGGGWWNYPALLAESPNGIVVLPFFATLTMLLVSAGVGVGMAVAVVLSAKLIRQRRRELGRPTAVGGLAGLTPAMIALVTLGACCSTTAAATAGIALTAQASGTTLGALLYNTWFLGVFQMVVLGVALLAQEELVLVYGALLGLPSTGGPAPTPAPVDGRFLASGALRVGLIAAGVTWALTLLAEWTGASPPALTVATVAGAAAEHLFLPLVALAGALAPGRLLGWAEGTSHRPVGRIVRGALLVTSLALLTWLPGGIASVSFHGLANELFAAAGASSAWAPIGPGVPAGLALGLRWSFQFLLLGAFGLALAVAPARVARFLSGTRTPVAEPRETPWARRRMHGPARPASTPVEES